MEKVLNKELFKNIERLCGLSGVSGREEAVAKEIMSQIKKIATTAEIDNLGNVIAFKKGKKVPKNKIMLSAHTDEVGMLVTDITNEGFLRFTTVGGINSKVILGRQVCVSEKNIPGIIGVKALHQADNEERGKTIETDKLLIDIGASDKKDAQKHISLGDSVTFICDYRDFGESSMLSKALDDRAGCAVLIEIMKTELEYDTYFAFSVQEEVGLRGARVAAHTIAPDVAIIVETTASGDVADVKDEKRVSIVGGGAVVSYMDRSTIYDKGLYKLAFELAKSKKIPVQTKTMISGGNDAGAIHVSGKGVRTIAISAPSKYIHSPSSVIDKFDMQAVLDITLALTNAVGE